MKSFAVAIFLALFFNPDYSISAVFLFFFDAKR
jgi:hypothetical protein